MNLGTKKCRRRQLYDCFPATSVSCGIYRASAGGWPCHRWGRKGAISRGSSRLAEPVCYREDATDI